MSKKNAPLHTTGLRGEKWFFQPETGRWSVEYGDKKSSSINPETLHQKVQSWIKQERIKAQAGASSGEQAPTDSRDLMLMLLSRDQEVPNATPVAVRASWDPEKGHIVAKKIKILSAQDNTGDSAGRWVGINRHDGVLLDPFAVTEEEYAALKERVRASYLTQKAYEAERAIAQAWIDRQGAASGMLEWNPHQGDDPVVSRYAPSAKEGRPPASRYHGTVPLGVSLRTLSKKDPTPSGWVEKEGAWEKGDVRVSMRISGLFPEFVVQARNLPGQEEGVYAPVFSHESFHHALEIAQITVDLMENQSPVVSVWKGHPNWVDQRSSQGIGLDWPSATDVLGVVCVSSIKGAYLHRDPRMLVLQRDTGGNRYRIEEGQASKWEWDMQPMTPLSRLSSFWARGESHPSDLVDALRTSLHQVMSGEAFDGAPPVRPHHSDDPGPKVTTGSHLWPGFRERTQMKEATRRSLQYAWGRIDDKGEPEDAASAQAAMEDEWARLVKGLETRVQSDPQVVKVVQEWEKMANDYVAKGPKISTPRRAGLK